MELMERRALLLKQESELPPTYTKVDYIQAESYAYIATDYVPKMYDEVYIEYMADRRDKMETLFSAGTGDSQFIMLGFSSSGQAYYFRYFSTDGATEFYAAVPTGVWQTMTINANGVANVNGKTATKTPNQELDGTDTTLYIFRRRTTSYPYYGKLRAFSITNNGILKMKLIPCIRNSDNVAGAYDVVAHKFYSSATASEAFIPGTLNT